MRGRVFQTVLQLHDLQAGNTISFVVIIPPSFSIFSKRPRHLHHGGEKFSSSLGHPPSLSLSPSLSLPFNFLYFDGKLTLIGSTSIVLMRKVVESEKKRRTRRSRVCIACLSEQHTASYLLFSIWFSEKSLSPLPFSFPWIFQVWKLILLLNSAERILRSNFVMTIAINHF